ncbi:MAG: glutathione S-transferase family protein [Pseudobdellovibrionaceae bacterium]
MKIYGAKAPWPFLKGLIRDNRPVWFLEEIGIPYNRISLDPMKGENRDEKYKSLNPFQKVPTLEHNGFVLSQSAAILNYLATTTGKLYPTHPNDQAKHLEWMFYCMSDIEAHAVQLVTLVPMTDEGDRIHAEWMLKRAEKILERALNYLDEQLQGRQYLMGDHFYAVDVLLGCCLYPIREHLLIKNRENIKNLLSRYYARPAFQRMLEINGT